MKRWLGAALDYLPRWLEHQMRVSEQPGCAIAVAHDGKLVLEQAFGHANLVQGTVLTPQHRFRVASHSKTFTTVAIMKLREAGRLQLDDRIGRHVDGLHRDVAATTLAQLLSHTAGLVRDGTDAGQWQDRRPFLDEAALRADLADGLVIDASSRLKYSNHGYGLLGLAIEAVTGEPYVDWMRREVIAPAGLAATSPDAPIDGALPFANGHSAKWPLGRRVVIAGDNPTNALASATGFVSTAGDLARFFGSLSPQAKRGPIGKASRRLMWHRQWPDPYSSLNRGYGLGTMCGSVADWEWFGHTGGFQGTLTRTACVPAQGLAVTVLTNAADGMSNVWVDGALQVLRAHAVHGAPSKRAAAWSGRWWTLWGASDLLPMDGKVLVANPALANPMLDATEFTPDSRERGRITLAGAFGNHGETVQLRHDARGKASEFWLGGTKMLPERRVAKELSTREGGSPEAAMEDVDA